jgi:hypothetical protein
MSKLLTNDVVWRVCSTVRRNLLPWRNEIFECCAHCFEREIPDERIVIMRRGRCPQCGSTKSVEACLADIFEGDQKPGGAPWLHFR